MTISLRYKVKDDHWLEQTILSLVVFITCIKLCSQVQSECEDLQYQVEVRNITARISNLAQKLDAVSSLADPRENAFLCCDVNEDVIRQIETCLTGLARVRTTTTFPSLSTLSMKGKTAILVINLLRRTYRA